MHRAMQHLSIVFAAGVLGGLINSLAVWLLGWLGLTKSAPAFTGLWLYPRLVWGGIWGFLFYLPWPSGSYLRRGLVLSLAPTLAQLFLVFPFKLNKGIMGLQLGYQTPFLVLFFNSLWGLAAGFWLKFSRKS